MLYPLSYGGGISTSRALEHPRLRRNTGYVMGVPCRSPARITPYGAVTPPLRLAWWRDIGSSGRVLGSLSRTAPFFPP
jgi:hypothetical protein